MGQLEGKISIITGGGTGIGLGIARAFVKEGAKVVLAARNLPRLEEAANELQGLGGTVEVVPTDVTQEAEVQSLFSKTMDTFGRLDIQVNNSGAFDGGPIDEITLETWNKVIGVNLTGVFLCTREAMRIMKTQKGGRIINIGSISSRMPRMNSAPYTSSKHAVIGLTKSTALEGRPYGISAGALHPGNVEVEWRAKSTTSMDQESMMTPDDIAVAALAMAVLPPYVNMLDATVLPVEQLYVGRG
ncbi:MAG: SDR family oxidoreductase [SAR202 cluster bacterium]|nr:SDR family oxidoreductase [SAR202 cluster bacterium]